MLNEISSEFEKVRQKHHSTNDLTSKLISDLKDTLSEYEQALSSLPEDIPKEKQTESYLPFLDNCNNKITKLDINKYYNTICNNFYGSLSKLGKIMLKDFERENIDDFELYPYNKKLFYTIIAKDLYRRGDFNTSDSFIKEANLAFDQNFRFNFKDLNLITRDLKNHNLETLTEWCTKYQAFLDNMKSKLQFECTKLSYVLLIHDPNVSVGQCVEFSKKKFASYLRRKGTYDEISKLMTLLIFKSNMDQCPYKELNIDALWNKVTSMFINDCCAILNLPNESWFYLSIVAGMISLPQILKAESILKTKRDIISEKELPYEIQLPNQLKFHNLFICPVTKEISTPENPPMLLTCGHCVSQNALEKMQKGGGSHANQIKCPTCPNVQHAKDAQKLFIF